MFSYRTAWDISESAYAAAVRSARAENRVQADLTLSNPTECGFFYDAETLLGALAVPAAMQYDPDPRGIPSARAAVADYYAAHGISLNPERFLLTTSTSEAYSYLFRLLCDPGDEVLVPQPSYPLFDFLAGLDNVRLVQYPLFQDHGWHIDLAALEASITPKTRAILVVHPNNPTGHFTAAAERHTLQEICARHNLALIVDEVFLDYPVEVHGASFASGDHPAITFILSGMSKVAGLPQMKSAWLLACGPEDLRQQALARLEVIADTFLSMNAPVQHALPVWLREAGKLQQQIRDRVRQNLATLDKVLTQTATLSRLPVEAGWVTVLRLPAIEDDTTLAIRLLHEFGVVVHPGSFYGFPAKGWLVLSLLPQPDVFLSGIGALSNL